MKNLPLINLTLTVPSTLNVICTAVLLALILTIYFNFSKLIRQKLIYRFVLHSIRYGGPLPRHVAFIMDGNRRWARRLNLPPSKGHPEGGEKLIESLQWCLEANIDTVTVFAFSIENFKRSKEEVNELMSLAERTFYRFSNQKHIIHDKKMRIQFWGDWNLISPKLRQIMSKLVKETSSYINGPVLNICFAYAGRYDIANAVKDVVSLCDNHLIKPQHINEDLISACLSSGTAKSYNTSHIDSRSNETVKNQHSYPDLLIRTSGETRLSDFLLWESSYSILSFYPALWPDFTVWDFTKILVQYQKHIRQRNVNYSSLQTSSSSSNGSSKHCAAITKIASDHMKSILSPPS